MKQTIKQLILLGAVLITTLSCRTQNCIPTVEYRDSIRTEYKLDSVYVYDRDSIYIDREYLHDTLFLTKEVYKWRTKDKIVEKHDTVYVNNETTVVQTQEVLPAFYKNCTIGFWVLLVLTILVIVARILIKIYLKK